MHVTVTPIDSGGISVFLGSEAFLSFLGDRHVTYDTWARYI